MGRIYDLIGMIIGDHEQWRKAEGLLGFAALAWGLNILLHEGTFATALVYRDMVGPEWLWGTAATAQGVARIYVTQARWHQGRMLASVTGVALWSVLATAGLIANPASGGAAQWAVFAVASVLVYVAGLHCHVDERGRCNGLAELTMIRLGRRLGVARRKGEQ